MAAKKFDRRRVGERKTRHGYEYSYTTKNDLWYVTCEIRQLPGGLFRSGEVWKSKIVPTFDMMDHKLVETGTRKNWKRFAYWNFALEKKEEMEFTNPKLREGHLPQYVVDICQELSDLMAAKFPERGLGVGTPSDGGMRVGERDFALKRGKYSEEG